MEELLGVAIKGSAKVKSLMREAIKEHQLATEIIS